MNWGAFDLNLLVVFDAVMQERSVTRAGQKIGLSQPAMSHALNRLRHMLKDQLFVRTPDGMVPTARAEQLAAPLRRALGDMQRALEPEVFDPREADRRFTIAANNYAAVVLSPQLVIAAVAAAPAVQLDLRPAGTQSLFDLLDHGDLDLAIGNFADAGERFRLRPLLEDRFVLVMRRGHPAERRKLTATSFAALRHLEVSATGEDTSFIDTWLAQQGLSRRIAHTANYLSTARILAQSEIVATLSRRMAEAYMRSDELQIRELPCPSPPLALAMAWHRRLENQPAHRWLRGLIEATCQLL